MELYQNTIIKLVTRQGSDSDRRYIVLDSGEPAYTTDTKRFFIGDGVLSGGVVVGNMYKGKAADITTLAPCLPGDFAYWEDKGNLYVLKPNVGDGSSMSDWELIGGGYYTGSKYITISSNNVISLNKLSAYSVDSDFLTSTNFFYISGGKLTVSLSSYKPIYFDGYTIKLAALSANSLSNDVIASDAPIRIDGNGRLALQTQLPLFYNNNTLKLSALSARSLSNDVISLSAPIIIDADGRLDLQVDSPLTVISNTLKVSLLSLYNLIYPIGSVYYTVSGTNPTSLFVGTTWTQIAEGRFIVGVGTGTDSDSNQQTFTQGQNAGLYIDKNVPNHNHYIANSGIGPSGSDPTISGTNVMAWQGGGNMAGTQSYKLDGIYAEATMGNTSGVLSSIYVPSLSTTIASTATSLSSITNAPPSFGLYVWQRTA